MEERYMVFDVLMMDERRKGRHEGKIEGKIEASIENLLELLEELSVVPENLRKTIMEETDLSKLKRWLKLAAKSSSIEQFMENM